MTHIENNTLVFSLSQLATDNACSRNICPMNILRIVGRGNNINKNSTKFNKYSTKI